MVIGIDNFVLYDHHYTETTRILSVGSNPNKMLLKISKISRANNYLELNFTFSELIFSLFIRQFDFCFRYKY